jgi:carbonic anhydrase
MRPLPPASAEALERLMAGSALARSGSPLPVPDEALREALATQQKPFAVVVSCVDSRVIPELLFHQEPGSLIVARVPGNAVYDTTVAAVDFAVGELGVPLVYVLGHSQCGAMQIALAAIDQRSAAPRGLRGIVRALAPAVKRTRHEREALPAATAENVRLVAATLARRSGALRAALKANAAGVAGGVYDIRSGDVTRLL